MGNLEGAWAVHINFPLLSFYLCTTFKTGIAAAGEPIPSEEGRFGEWPTLKLLRKYPSHQTCYQILNWPLPEGIFQNQSILLHFLNVCLLSLPSLPSPIAIQWWGSRLLDRVSGTSVVIDGIYQLWPTLRPSARILSSYSGKTTE